MLYVYGCPISVQAARDLVATLIANGGPDAIAAAGQIDYALHRDCVTTGLSPGMRDAVFAVLNDPPPDLRPLRERLERDIAHRSHEPSSVPRVQQYLTPDQSGGRAPRG